MARLITAGLDEAGFGATGGAPSAGGRPPQAVATPPARQQGGAALPAAPPGVGEDGPADPPTVDTRVAGGTPAQGFGVAVASAGMILLVLSALIVHWLVGGRADDPHRRRSVLEGARAAHQDLRQRGEVLPVVVLVVVSLALWGAITLWVLTR
jgi:hypothetical protein